MTSIARRDEWPAGKKNATALAGMVGGALGGLVGGALGGIVGGAVAGLGIAGGANMGVLAVGGLGALAGGEIGRNLWDWRRKKKEREEMPPEQTD